MSAAPGSLLRATLAVPALGQASRLHLGDLQLVLERVRGALSLCAHDGVQARTHLLGVAGDGTLEVVAAAPRHPVRVGLRESVTLAPLARIRGYVSVPLPRRLAWRRADGREDVLLELVPSELRTQWLGEGAGGGYAHRAASSFLRLVNGHGPAHDALVPVTAVNAGAQRVRLGQLAVQLRDRDLRELRGRIVAAPRRLRFTGETEWTESVRDWPRRRGET
jgi:hypothetical protein